MTKIRSMVGGPIDHGRGSPMIERARFRTVPRDERAGMPHAVRDGVVRDFRALVCWRLSHDLKCEVFDFTESGPAARDYKYRDQIRDSGASAPANIAEGFGRFVPADFAQFLKYARASLMETQNHLI